MVRDVEPAAHCEEKTGGEQAMGWRVVAITLNCVAASFVKNAFAGHEDTHFIALVYGNFGIRLV
jgi:hypothetical protein